ncbi:MAG: hypothetical protein R3B57_13745 [Phycisphaerales bacterium]
MRGPTIAAICLGAALLAAVGAGEISVQPGNQGAAQPADRPTPDQVAKVLLDGLRRTEGCLSADACQWKSGKNSVCAWFENKAAVVRWYESETHQFLINTAAGGVGARHKPLQYVADEETPIMVIATISFDGPPAIAKAKLPFSQLSIELYQPLPGGASINGRLAPDGFKVEHMQQIKTEG